MTHSYTAPWRKLALAALLGLAGTTAAQAQALNYNQFGATNTVGTYSDLGTTGAPISTANTDNANSAVTPIGFTFSFNGASFTDFVLNTNGFIKLGTTDISDPATTNYIAASDMNIIAPASGIDLVGASNQTASPTEYRVVTTGSAGSRVCTIQFKNVADKPVAGASQFATMQFQIKLYETSNRIEFVYGTWTAGTAAPLGAGFFVGLKGSSAATTDRLFAQKASSATPWSTTVFVTESNGLIPPHFVRNTFLPDAGRTYRFTQAIANDAFAQIIYSLGKAPVGSPQVVQALISNTGSTALTNLPVTLNVTGANTFSDAKIITTLAPGTSTLVSFTAFTPNATGNNTLVVSVPADAVNTNNSQIYTQVVTANTFSYANNTPFDPNQSVGFTAATTGAFVTKFNTPAPRTITAVGAGLADPNTVGRTIYSIVVNAAGAVLGRSADYVVQTADINTLKTLPLQTAVATPAGNFYVGVVQTAAPTGGARYFPLATYAESPARTATFYTIAPFTAAGGTLAEAGIPYVMEAQTSIVQGTSEALNRAIAMYPNPSTGLVKLDVRGANAKGNLQVSVTNMLGQTVHTATLKDNFTNEVNLSSLANGMYLLKVQTGADYTVRQLTITK
ncbi:T9SS type A sorting domain-containing protein [Hymenobacter puniceus]|uniref:T9SS type A sorting domain-containing protein n=1 Tax=Hymenobacter sp. BT190 TaxID=2763505 RepID=UPI0016518620|nr:T9SS type A sorting domain-containing protein [Hymenobacter sp. BT190]MBC6697480.1 T9SS type A sorting domain-containing protein [Hymenobacter sp. BT190]